MGTPEKLHPTAEWPEGTAGDEEPQRSWRPKAADYLTALRIPLAALFVAAPGMRLGVLIIAGVSDLLDGVVARATGSTRLGAFLDPVADKLFMVAAFGVVAASGVLAWYEIGAVLFRDLVAAIAFLVTASRKRAKSIPARLGGKAVTLLQMLTLGAFVLELPVLRQLAWATGAVAIYAVWDYVRASNRAVEL